MPSYICKTTHPFGNNDHKNQRRLLLTLVICTTFMLIELIGGYLSGSLAIMSDAAHLLSGINHAALIHADTDLSS